MVVGVVRVYSQVQCIAYAASNAGHLAGFAYAASNAGHLAGYVKGAF